MDRQRYLESLQLAGQVERLIAQLVPETNGADDPKAVRLLQFSMRILSSRMAGASLTPLVQSVELARRRLVQAGRASDALALSDFLQRLERSSHGLANLPAVLQLLTALMNSQPASSLAACAGAALLSRPMAPVAAPAIRMDIAAVSPPEPGKTEDVPTPQPVAARDGRAVGASGSRWKPAPGAGLSEEVLVRELLFVLQNIEGVHIRWDQNRRVTVSQCVRNKSYPCRHTVKLIRLYTTPSHMLAPINETRHSLVASIRLCPRCMSLLLP